MIEFKNTIFIERPIEEVFAFVSDFENMSKWNYYVVDVNKITAGPLGEGTVYHQVRKKDQQKYQVTEFKPNEAVAIETLPPEKMLRMRFRFKPSKNGTELIDEWQLETHIPAPFSGIATKRVKSAVSENLDKLKTLLETGQTALQDGRVIMF